MTSDKIQDTYLDNRPVEVYGRKAYLANVSLADQQIEEVCVEFADTGRHQSVLIDDVYDWLGE